MKFFTEEELEEYYGKSFDEISPTDTPLDEYVCGNDSICCQECEQVLPVECFNVVYADYDSATPSVATGFKERAYCNACEIQYVRTRKPVSDEVSYQSPDQRVDEREEYICSDCHQRHPITVPDSDFQYRTDASITSHETVYLSCPCGETMTISSLEFSSEVPCLNCSRVFTFDIETND